MGRYIGIYRVQHEVLTEKLKNHRDQPSIIRLAYTRFAEVLIVEDARNNLLINRA